MRYKATINIMPHKELLDPQGKTVRNNLPNIGVDSVEDVRIGKRVEMTLNADTEALAKEQVESACSKLLANMIMESYEYDLSPA